MSYGGSGFICHVLELLFLSSLVYVVRGELLEATSDPEWPPSSRASIL